MYRHFLTEKNELFALLSNLSSFTEVFGQVRSVVFSLDYDLRTLALQTTRLRHGVHMFLKKQKQCYGVVVHSSVIRRGRRIVSLLRVGGWNPVPAPVTN